MLHSAVVGMWVAVLPSALVPLWQLEQVPFASAWLNVLTGDQAVVVWQFSQTLLVERWVADFPVAEVPLWQLAQVPDTLAWLNVAGVQPLVL